MKNRIKNPSIERLGKKAGIKSMAADCHTLIRRVILAKLHDIAKNTLITNSENHTKTIMPSDVFNALTIMGYNVGESNCMGRQTSSK